VKIGIMLRHLDQHAGGVLVYTQNLLRELLALDTEHQFVLMYRNAAHLGRYPAAARVRERVMPGWSVLSWDQVAVPRMVEEEHIDLVFNPKYSIPLHAQCKSVFVCHGLDWYVTPQWSRWIDRLSHRYIVPRYAGRADHIIAVSDTTREHVQRYLGVPPARVTTVYHGVEESFREPVSPAQLADVRGHLRLPDRFFLYCGQIYPPKNFGRLLRAYAQVGPELGVALAVAGGHTWLCAEDLELVEQLGIKQWVVSLGWVERVRLPALYAQALALVQPSLYESFGLPLVEAMASGCPVVTSNRYGPAEIAKGAGLLVEPESVESIAESLRRVAVDADLRAELSAAGRERARAFTWDRCARETLAVLEAAARDERRVAAAV
jgi:glycosyltransferase involved in cell wall biosynthesis